MGYIPGEDNEHLLGNIIAEVDRQHGQQYRKVKSVVFTEQQKLFIRNRIAHVSADSRFTQIILASKNTSRFALSRVHPSALLRSLRGIQEV